MIVISEEQEKALERYQIGPGDVLSIKRSKQDGAVVACVMPESRALESLLRMIAHQNLPIRFERYTGIVNDLISHDDEIAVDVVFYISKVEMENALKSHATESGSVPPT